MLEQIICRELENYVKTKLSCEKWDQVYLDIMSITGLSPVDIQRALSKYQFSGDMGDMFVYVLNHYIQNRYPNELWRDLVSLSKREVDTPYKTVTTWIIKVMSKRDKLNSLSSDWVYEHHSEVEEFMGDNPFYNEIMKIHGRVIQL